MLNMEKTIKNLIGMEVTDDFYTDVVCAFETTDEEVFVEEQYGRYEDYQAYEGLEDAPIICIKIENGVVTDAWEAY